MCLYRIGYLCMFPLLIALAATLLSLFFAFMGVGIAVFVSTNSVVLVVDSTPDR